MRCKFKEPGAVADLRGHRGTPFEALPLHNINGILTKLGKVGSKASPSILLDIGTSINS